jgi:transcriptional regulator with XRE-family HTH domain
MLFEINSNQFAKNLRYLRQKRRLSQKALAEAVGVNRYFIRGIESGALRPIMELDTFAKICDYFAEDHNDMLCCDLTTPSL